MSKLFLLYDRNHIEAMLGKKNGWLWVLVFFSSLIFSVAFLPTHIFAFLGDEAMSRWAQDTYGDDHIIACCLMTVFTGLILFHTIKFHIYGFDKIKYPLLIYASTFIVLAIQLLYRPAIPLLFHPAILGSVLIFIVFFIRLNSEIHEYFKATFKGN